MLLDRIEDLKFWPIIHLQNLPLRNLKDAFGEMDWILTDFFMEFPLEVGREYELTDRKDIMPSILRLEPIFLIRLLLFFLVDAVDTLFFIGNIYSLD